jgi:flagellar hook-length control protein FliK
MPSTKSPLTSPDDDGPATKPSSLQSGQKFDRPGAGSFDTVPSLETDIQKFEPSQSSDTKVTPYHRADNVSGPMESSNGGQHRSVLPTVGVPIPDATLGPSAVAPHQAKFSVASPVSQMPLMHDTAHAIYRAPVTIDFGIGEIDVAKTGALREGYSSAQKPDTEKSAGQFPVAAKAPAPAELNLQSIEPGPEADAVAPNTVRTTFQSTPLLPNGNDSSLQLEVSGEKAVTLHQAATPVDLSKPTVKLEREATPNPSSTEGGGTLSGDQLESKEAVPEPPNGQTSPDQMQTVHDPDPTVPVSSDATTHIRLSDRGHAPSLAPGHLPHGLSARLAETVARFPDRPVVVTLSPEELGRVRMALTTTDGALTMVVHADRPETLDLLRRHIDTLAQDFRDLGFENLDFYFGRDQTPRRQREPRDINADQPDSSHSSPAHLHPESIPATILPTSGLDLRL